MARVYKKKNKQTSPELAGEQNMTEDLMARQKDKVQDDLMGNLAELFDVGVERMKKGTNWTPEEMYESIRNYFQFCVEKVLKPTKSGLATWLGCSTSQYHAWYTDKGRYGAISELITHANQIIENQYINRSESFPTANIFLLKTSHGYVETSKVDVTTNTQTNPEDVKDLISKLGLDKQK